MQKKIVLVGLLIVLAWSAVVNADETINTLSLWDGEKQLGGFGEPNTAYVGQSFVALGERIEALSFLLDGRDDMGENQPGVTEFHVLITPLAATGDRPDFDNILFESSLYSTTLNTGWEAFDVNLDIPVQSGQRYMWVLDAFCSFDGEAGTAVLAASYDSYDNGEFRFRNIYDPPYNGTRPDHDDKEWLIVQPPDPGETPTVDAAFSMTFIPEPTFGAILCILSVMGGVRKNT